MMDNNNLLTKLSQSLLEILNDNEYCDVNVEAGSNLGEPKTFRAHMVILNYRSPYLRRLLSKNKKKDDENFARISIPTIQADTFQIILRKTKSIIRLYGIMDDNKFLPKLSQNLLELLDDDEFYNITIEVGGDPYVKIFRAHMNILSYRSPYFRKILSDKNKSDGTLTHIKLSDVLPEIFQLILR
ncbi:hypothetical protein RhiirB3_467699 [Rhizophagus irregularis]|nr:hypothetical protein RhiirB3_467699 [Rhizophagus irregularis]